MVIVYLHKSLLAVAIMGCAVCVAGPRKAEAASKGTIYRYVDKNGTVYFSDYRRNPKYQVMVWSLRDQTNIINRTLLRISQEYNVPPSLVKAVIHAESSYRPNAISPAGAMGLMQLMPNTAAELKVINPLDIEQNLRGGISYLQKMLKRFSGDTRLALAAYNAGPTAVRKHEGVPPFPETQNYVKRVLALQNYYESH